MSIQKRVTAAPRLVLIVAMGLTLLVGLTYFTVHEMHGNPLRKTDEFVEEGAWIGYYEQTLVRKLGVPAAVFPSYVRVGPDEPTNLPGGPYRTLRYDHPDGTLYVWLHQVDERYRCFDSLWFDKDVEF